MDRMMGAPAIDAELVARLVWQQHPQLAGPVSLLSHGWDNDIFRLGDSLAVRLPRRAQAEELILKEQFWLERIEGMLHVRIPVPVAAGVPTAEYAWHWSVTPWFDGEPAWLVPRLARVAFASDLARFLTELHVAAPAAAPINPVRGVPLSSRDHTVRERLAGFDPALGAIWADAVAADPWTHPAVWLHGDLHPANLLVSAGAEPQIRAVIDFGDLSSGDPATDLAAAWLFFDPAGRAVFRRSLDHFDTATWRRARGWAVALATAAVFGSARDSPMIAIGHEAIEQLLRD
jgi:aminoglycoside phosphotransferase (APT) family kinase protein